MNRIEANVQTGETTEIPLTPEEVAELPPPLPWSRQPLLKIVRAGREIALNRLAGIAFAAKEAGNPATVSACLSARQALLDITKLPAVMAATDDASLAAAIGSAYSAIIAASPPIVISAFADIQS